MSAGSGDVGGGGGDSHAWVWARGIREQLKRQHDDAGVRFRLVRCYGATIVSSN